MCPDCKPNTLFSFSLILLLTQGAGHGVCQEPHHVGHEARTEAILVRGANTRHQLSVQWIKIEVGQQAKVRWKTYQCGER